ncbi:hypothetical protein SELMODRAFT_425346 [Selaginella moellendorffii]|uniref:Uncharacterized protein n=1 Tax=Selaginella moellendorffii TaxID=88036 RepID=D8SST4_SELML|nr:hypothetical protein SELMODRAFT_425346 [Selaginella moellendorffii]
MGWGDVSVRTVRKDCTEIKTPLRLGHTLERREGDQSLEVGYQVHIRSAGRSGRQLAGLRSCSDQADGGLRKEEGRPFEFQVPPFSGSTVGDTHADSGILHSGASFQRDKGRFKSESFRVMVLPGEAEWAGQQVGRVGGIHSNPRELVGSLGVMAAQVEEVVSLPWSSRFAQDLSPRRPGIQRDVEHPGGCFDATLPSIAMATEIAQLSPRSVPMALALNTDLKFHEWEARLSGRWRQGPPKETTRAGATQSGMPTPDQRKQCK